MKKIVKALIFVLVLSFAASETYAQVIVRYRPARPREVIVRRPPPPSARHVWVREEWRPEGGRYVWHGGYWAAPARPNAVYVPGHWRHTFRGYVWIPGGWR